MEPISVISPEKISEALGIPWEHPREEDCNTGEIEVLDRIYVFPLRENLEGLSFVALLYYSADPDEIKLQIESGGYQSIVSFEEIQKVEYVSQYRYVEFKRWRGDYPDKLKVWWRGQFDLYLS